MLGKLRGVRAGGVEVSSLCEKNATDNFQHKPQTTNSKQLSDVK